MLLNENKIRKPFSVDFKDVEIACILKQIEVRDRIIRSQSNLMNYDNSINDKNALDLLQNNNFLIRNRSEILKELYTDRRNVDYLLVTNREKPMPYSNFHYNKLKKNKRSISHHITNLADNTSKSLNCFNFLF